MGVEPEQMLPHDRVAADGGRAERGVSGRPRALPTAATGMIQKLSALIRGNAMSFAPMSGGTMRFPNPARIGIETRKIIVVPCIVNNSEYVFASTMVGPG